MLPLIGMLALAGTAPADVAQHKNLAVYAIYEPLGPVDDSMYITLDEGLKSGKVTISERGGATPIIRQTERRQQQSSGAVVNTLWLTNRSGKKLILLSGELVRGGQQDRIIGKDALIPSGKEAVDLGVFCVEHGRWEGEQQFGVAAPAAALAMPSVRNSAQVDSNQQKVWDNVDRAGGGAARLSKTAAYRDVVSNKEVSASVESYVRAISAQFPESKAVGVAVAMNGRLHWVDRFANNALFRKYWPRLLRSYATEAMGAPLTKAAVPSQADAMRFVADHAGKMTYEGEDGSRLVRIENSSHVIFQLQDTATTPLGRLHESKVMKANGSVGLAPPASSQRSGRRPIRTGGG